MRRCFVMRGGLGKKGSASSLWSTQMLSVNLASEDERLCSRNNCASAFPEKRLLINFDDHLYSPAAASSSWFLCLQTWYLTNHNFNCPFKHFLWQPNSVETSRLPTLSCPVATGCWFLTNQPPLLQELHYKGDGHTEGSRLIMKVIYSANPFQSRRFQTPFST